MDWRWMGFGIGEWEELGHNDVMIRYDTTNEIFNCYSNLTDRTILKHQRKKDWSFHLQLPLISSPSESKLSTSIPNYLQTLKAFYSS